MVYSYTSSLKHKRRPISSWTPDPPDLRLDPQVEKDGRLALGLIFHRGDDKTLGCGSLELANAPCRQRPTTETGACNRVVVALLLFVQDQALLWTEAVCNVLYHQYCSRSWNCYNRPLKQENWKQQATPSKPKSLNRKSLKHSAQPYPAKPDVTWLEVSTEILFRV